MSVENVYYFAAIISGVVIIATYLFLIRTQKL